MKVIIGLGNPGKDYKRTRHNVGFMTIEKLAKDLKIDVAKSKFNSVYGETNYKGEKILLMKPLTYMNSSGVAVRDLVNFFKVDPADIIVIYDDVDIDFGDIRVRKQGSAGSHNGMKSIIYQIQNDQFPRIRIGIGKKHEQQDLANFVLTNFSKEEMEIIEEATELAAEAALDFVENGIDHTMNNFNNRKKETH